MKIIVRPEINERAPTFFNNADKRDELEMAADRFNFNKSWEHIQNKHVGTGHSDISKFEWAVNQHRDTIASYIGHYDTISYFSVAQNESNGRVRYQLLEVS